MTDRSTRKDPQQWPREKRDQLSEKPGAIRPAQPSGELNGPRGPEPTRFGDWEKNGRCSDF
ncbi:MAG: succinate dehydrogenase assembly factor 4 [Pseudomonadota bacterium]